MVCIDHKCFRNWKPKLRTKLLIMCDTWSWYMLGWNVAAFRWPYYYHSWLLGGDVWTHLFINYSWAIGWVTSSQVFIIEKFLLFIQSYSFKSPKLFMQYMIAKSFVTQWSKKKLLGQFMSFYTYTHYSCRQNSEFKNLLITFITHCS
jgi:hypothetical protein